MKKNNVSEKLQEIFYGLIYGRLNRAWGRVQKRSKNDEETEKKAKKQVIYEYTMMLFLILSLIAGMFTGKYNFMEKFSNISFYLISGGVCIIFYQILEFLLRLVFFHERFWTKVYKYKSFIKESYYLRYRIIAVFLLLGAYTFLAFTLFFLLF